MSYLFLFLQKVKNKFNKEFKYIFSRLAQSDGADCYCFFVIMNRNFNAPLHALSVIVLVEALCRSRAIFFLTLDGNSSFHVEWLVPLSRICKTFSAS